MASTFSTNDTECLGRATEHELEINSLDDIWNDQRLNECVLWIKENQFQKVRTQ